ncbi:MAG: hypothetical protein ABWY81_10935 [Jiangellaceae bacterium]
MKAKFRLAPPPERVDWREILARDAAARLAEPESYVAPAVLPPRIPARPCQGPGEIAGWQGKQAVGLGRRAMEAGWTVGAWYWMAGDGSEGCAVRLRRDVLRGVATWKRAAGKVGAKSGWVADVAYAWRSDVSRMPQKVGHVELEGLVMSA